MEEIVHMPVDSHELLHIGMVVSGGAVFPKLFSVGFVMAKILFLIPLLHTHRLL